MEILDQALTVISFVVVSYCIGSIPFGFLLTKIFIKQDVRIVGSGNIGATNVLRTGHKKLAASTLLLDALKGVVAVWWFFILLNFYPVKFISDLRPSLLLYGLFAILGHCYPVWLKFKGGKGVATMFGVLLAAAPLAGLVAATTWGIVAGFFRYASLASLSAAAIAPLVVLLIYGWQPAVVALLIALLVFWRHKGNIQRLVSGGEPKIGQKS